MAEYSEKAILVIFKELPMWRGSQGSVPMRSKRGPEVIFLKTHLYVPLLMRKLLVCSWADLKIETRFGR